MSDIWVPLHVHSQYSILDAVASVGAIAERAKAFGMGACALTDHGNMYGAIDFYKACKEVKVKPIIGVEFWVAPEGRGDRKKEYSARSSTHLTLLAKNREGYHNLAKLSSKGFLEGYYYHPRVDFELLKEHAAGLICLSGCLAGPVAREILTGTEASTGAMIEQLQSIYGEDFYFELQRHKMDDDQIQADGMARESWLIQNYLDYIQKQEKVGEKLVQLGKERGIKCVATQNSHYLDRSDWQAHEILLNIQSGEPTEIVEKDSFGNVKQRVPNPKRRVFPSHQFHFRSPAGDERAF